MIRACDSAIIDASRITGDEGTALDASPVASADEIPDIALPRPLAVPALPKATLSIRRYELGEILDYGSYRTTVV